MAMIWDTLLVSALRRELEPLLVGARLRGHVFRWDQRELVLHFRSGTLKWHLHPERGWVTFGAPEDPGEDARPLAAEVRRILAPPDERILEIHFQRPRGRARFYRLVVELMTNQWNALLLEGSEGRIRHLLWTRHLEDRDLVVGQRYRPPPASSRKGIHDSLDPGDWEALLEGLEAQEARETLLEQVAFTSPVNLPHILKGGDGKTADPPNSSAALHRWRQLKAMEPAKPCLLHTGRGKQPYPVIIREFDHTEFPDLLSAIRAVSPEAPSGGQQTEVREREELARALHQARGRVRGIRREMEEAEDPEEPRTLANLVLARLGEIPRGADSVSLTGFQGEQVEVTLDPALPPQENAERLYREAARRERARDRLPALLKEAEESVQALEGLRKRLEEGDVTAQEIREEIPDRGRKKKKPGQRQEERLPYHSFTSSGGLEIRVGRGSKENDDLTFRHSRPDDVWLHARDSAGAHVILRWGKDGNPPRKDLGEAATLAALNSGARNAGTVPVDWTRRKHVRKPRKAPPGSVIPRQVQTLFVEPDPELPARLRADRPSPP